MTHHFAAKLLGMLLLIGCACMGVGCHSLCRETALRVSKRSVSPEEAKRLEKMYHDADLVLVCELRPFRVRRHAETPIKVIEVLRGHLFPGRAIIACYHLTPATDFPKPGSHWIVFFQEPHLIDGSSEYRYVVGEPFDQDGIVAASPERTELLKTRCVR